MSFVEKLIESIKDKKSVVCMGLDPRIPLKKDDKGIIPYSVAFTELDTPYIEEHVIINFNKVLIDNTCDLIPIIKPQFAFYAKYDALNALKETIKYAHKKDVLVILDAKRNDIGSTSEAYASEVFDVYGADACTINAYFGSDGVKPFLKYRDKGIFILVKTSNPSSGEFQDLFSGSIPGVGEKAMKFQGQVSLERNFIKMARLVNQWAEDNDLELSDDNYHNLGVVVGATFPEQLNFIRSVVQNSFILIPGYGAQGAGAKDIKGGFDKDGLGGVVNSSRGIMFAYNKNEKYGPDQFTEAAREEIIVMNSKINKAINL